MPAAPQLDGRSQRQQQILAVLWWKYEVDPTQTTSARELGGLIVPGVERHIAPLRNQLTASSPNVYGWCPGK
jgi:hypothetical protein